MATTSPFELALSECRVDFETACKEGTTVTFEAQEDGKTIQVTAALFPIVAPFNGCFFSCNHSPDLRVVGKNCVSRTRLPSKEELQCKVECALDEGDWGYIFKIDTGQWGFDARHWFYLARDRANGYCWEEHISTTQATAFRVAPNCPHFAIGLEDATSDVRFALSWLHLSVNERFKMGTLFARGDAEELHHVVAAIAVYEQMGLDGRHTYFAPDMGRFVAFRGAISSVSPSVSPSITPVMRWARHVSDYFGVSVNEELACKHSCAPTRPLWLSLKLSLPSQHERLEAALVLREWARDKIPPDELRLLLPTL